jgi:hypothetical protein
MSSDKVQPHTPHGGHLVPDDLINKAVFFLATATAGVGVGAGAASSFFESEQDASVKAAPAINM